MVCSTTTCVWIRGCVCWLAGALLASGVVHAAGSAACRVLVQKKQFLEASACFRRLPNKEAIEFCMEGVVNRTLAQQQSAPAERLRWLHKSLENFRRCGREGASWKQAAGSHIRILQQQISLAKQQAASASSNTKRVPVARRVVQPHRKWIWVRLLVSSATKVKEPFRARFTLSKKGTKISGALPYFGRLQRGTYGLQIHHPHAEPWLGALVVSGKQEQLIKRFVLRAKARPVVWPWFVAAGVLAAGAIVGVSLYATQPSNKTVDVLLPIGR